MSKHWDLPFASSRSLRHAGAVDFMALAIQMDDVGFLPLAYGRNPRALAKQDVLTCDSTIACDWVHRNRHAACRRLVATCHHWFGDEDVCTDRFAADRRATGSLLYSVVSARHSHLRRRLL